MPPSRAVFLGAHVRLQDLVGQRDGAVLVMLFLLGEIAEQAAHADILGLLGGPRVEALGLELHGLDLFPDGVERQVFRQPDRPPAQKAFDVLAADRRQVLAEAFLIEFQQPMPVAAFLLGHLLENLRRVRVTLAQVLGEGHVDAAVLLLGGDRDRKHLALGQFGKSLHGGPVLIV